MQYLDLDAVAAKSEFVIKLNGKEHSLKVASVETFLQNMKDLEGLAMNATVADEMRVAMNVVKRAFPTIPAKELDELTIIQIKAIADFAMTANGEKVETVEEDAEGNASAAS